MLMSTSSKFYAILNIRKTGEAVFYLFAKTKNMERMSQAASPYEGRPNQAALEQQRDKYIDQELDILLSADGQVILTEISNQQPGSNEFLEAVLDLVVANLDRKSGGPGNKENSEFTRESVLERMRLRGMFDEFDVEGQKITDIHIGGINQVHPRAAQRWTNV